MDVQKQVVFQLRDRAGKSRLWGHEIGRRLRSEVEAQLDALPPGGVQVIDLKGVEVFDFSFASEFLARLYASLATVYPGRALVLASPSDYVKVNLDAALKSLDQLALVKQSAKRWDVIGKVADTDRETLQALASKKRATAPELAESLNIKLTACNQRLRKLSDAGAILRTRFSSTSGGDQYLYIWPL